MLIMTLMTKNTVKHQKLEIMIKIAHDFLQTLINYCKKNNLKGITAKQISDQKIVKFDMTLTESLGIPKRELYEIMHEGIFGIAHILIDIMKETKVTKIPLHVLEEFEVKWDWKEIFKGITENRES